MKQGEIVDAGYDEGKRLFKEGGTLRHLITNVLVMQDDDNAMSMVIGFGDAFLDMLRNKR